MSRIKSGLFSSLVLVIIFAFLTDTTYSQDSTRNHEMNKKSTQTSTKYDRSVRMAVQKLDNKVKLTSDQTRQIEGILQDYKHNSSTQSSNSQSSGNNSNMQSGNDQTLDKIENILTSDQKTKFDQIKTEWWSTTEKNLSKTSSKSPKSNY